MKKIVYEIELSAAAALSRAVRSVGSDIRTITDNEVTLDNGYFFVRFCDDWMQYECYVDADTGEVPGIFSVPLAPSQKGGYETTGSSPISERAGCAFFGNQVAAALASSVFRKGLLRMMK